MYRTIGLGFDYNEQPGGRSGGWDHECELAASGRSAVCSMQCSVSVLYSAATCPRTNEFGVWEVLQASCIRYMYNCT
jgi:hypothetical protein